MNSTRIGLIAIAALALFTAHPASAATVTISSAASVDSPDYDLTNTYGATDWAYWENNAGDGGAPLNEKTGASFIGDISLVGASGALGGSSSSTRPVHDFAFSDGVNGAESSPKLDVIGLFNNDTDTTGNGVQVNVASPTADEYTIYLWGVGYHGAATLDATVGAASDADNTLDTGGTFGTRFGWLYTITVDPDSAGQAVNLSLTLTTDGSGSASHVSLAGVAVDAQTTVIPAPAALPAGLGLLTLIALRLRRLQSPGTIKDPA